MCIKNGAMPLPPIAILFILFIFIALAPKEFILFAAMWFEPILLPDRGFEGRFMELAAKGFEDIELADKELVNELSTRIPNGSIL